MRCAGRSACATLFGTMLLAGCASLSSNEFEQIPVTSTPSGADVTLDCGRGPTRIGTTPVTVVLRRRDSGCSIALTKEGWLGTRVDFRRTIARAVLGDVLAGALATLIVANSNIDFDAQNGTPSGGTVNVSASGSGTVSPAAAGAVVLSVSAIVDASTGAMFAHTPRRVHATLDPQR